MKFILFVWFFHFFLSYTLFLNSNRFLSFIKSFNHFFSVLFIRIFVLVLSYLLLLTDRSRGWCQKCSELAGDFSLTPLTGILFRVVVHLLSSHTWGFFLFFSVSFNFMHYSIFFCLIIIDTFSIHVFNLILHISFHS